MGRSRTGHARTETVVLQEAMVTVDNNDSDLVAKAVELSCKGAREYLKQVKNGIVHDLSAHAPGVDVDPVVDETGKEQAGIRMKHQVPHVHD
jgi:hypothetical protein